MQTIKLVHQEQRSRRSLEPAEINPRWLIKTIKTLLENIQSRKQ
jgi:hypothetical protein